MGVQPIDRHSLFKKINEGNKWIINKTNRSEIYFFVLNIFEHKFNYNLLLI